MIELLKNWIISVTAASIIAAAAVAVTPKGSVRKMVRFAGGLVLFIAMAAPLKEIDSRDIAFFSMQYRADYEGYEEKLIRANDTMIKSIIEDKTRTYILQKANELGIDCDAEIRTTKRDDGYPYPDSVTVSVNGNASPALQKELSRAIAAELGIPYDKQKWRQTEDE